METKFKYLTEDNAKPTVIQLEMVYQLKRIADKMGLK